MEIFATKSNYYGKVLKAQNDQSQNMHILSLGINQDDVKTLGRTRDQILYHGHRKRFRDLRRGAARCQRQENETVLEKTTGGSCEVT